MVLDFIKSIPSRLRFYIRHYYNKTQYTLSLKGRIAQRRWNKINGIHQLSDLEIYSIPVIINNFNRLVYIEILTKKLVSAGYQNIIIIDNASTYPPLLEYYKTCPFTVHRLPDNMEFMALWKSGLYEQYKNQYYVYTDPDVIPDDKCPGDYIHHFYRLLQKYPALDKVGFSLKIDDLPDYYDRKGRVLEIETPFWQKKVGEDYYKAAIDTTFALYRPGMAGTTNLNSGRSQAPYLALHLPWYNDSSNPDEETLYYRTQAVYSKNWA